MPLRIVAIVSHDPNFVEPYIYVYIHIRPKVVEMTPTY